MNIIPKAERGKEKFIKTIKAVGYSAITFSLNTEDKTAFVIGNNEAGNILIPRSIIHEKQEFIVAGILKTSEKINSIQFSYDSEIQIIEKKAFSGSSIESIIIPSSVTKICEGAFSSCCLIQKVIFQLHSKIQTIERNVFANSSIESITLPSSISHLCEGWCYETPNLKKFRIIPRKQKNISNFDDKFIIGKSDKKSDIYDVLIFACRDIKEAIIPDSINVIASYAFAHSAIEKIAISHHITKICEGSFYKCRNLQQVEIPLNSKLQEIRKLAFYQSSIESITIPSSVSELKEGWCEETPKLLNVTIMPNNKYFKSINDKLIVGRSDIKSDEFDVLVFASRDIKTVTIPFNIKRIASFAFAQSSIESISIPSKVRQICEGSFSKCGKLRLVEIQQDSELQLIDKRAFAETSIESIFIPEKVTKIGEDAFYSCRKLLKVMIKPNSELHTIEKRAFIHSSIKSIFIPSQVTTICECTFAWCFQLKKVEFASDSKLQVIEKQAFLNSQIESIVIPSCVSEFDDEWCLGMKNLNNISVIQSQQQNVMCHNDQMILGKTDLNSDDFDVLLFVNRNAKNITIPPFVRIIGSYAFSESLIENIYISPHITKICKGAFSHCMCIQKVEISENSELQIIDKYSFCGSSIKNIFIPPFVKNICEFSFAWCQKLHQIEFSPDSQLQTIENKAFYFSSIENLTIPASVSKLSEGWSSRTKKLEKVRIMKCNKNYKNFNDYLVVGKSDVKSEEFDVLVFAGRKIKSCLIPQKIKKISSYAFADSSITNIKISHHITQICEGSFYFCKQLKNIEIPLNSHLQVINESAFLECAISSIYIPPKVSYLGENSLNCGNLKIIEIDENTELRAIESRKMSYCKHVIIMIPIKLRNCFKVI